MKKLENKEFFVTDNAAKRINFLLEQEENKSQRLRIEVLGGGCSGFQYNMDFDTKRNEDDLIFENNKAQVIIDETSFDFISGSALDYVETLGSAAFEIKNPNATANCGCGNSFAV